MVAVLALAGMLIALLAPVYRTTPAAAAPTAAGSVAVKVAPSRHSTVIGNRFTFRSQLVNPGPKATGRLIAHLNVASLTNDVYVDPEDWSAERTLEVPPLTRGGMTSLTWDLQAVNAGRFAVYVVVLPASVLGTAGDQLVVSPAMQVDVAGRRTLNVGGALPVVLAVPIALALLALGVRRRIRRSS
jgi:hypothetical protein